MHLTYVEGGMLGSYAIVGAHLPISCGVAWGTVLRGEDKVTVAFFGDGATNIGAFHEALNLAAVWRLPIVFVCENNLYAEYTPISAVTPVDHPAFDRAGAYAMDAELVDGNDVVAVYDAVSRFAENARTNRRPALIEALTYRQGGHSRADPGTYRPAEEVEMWLRRDPLLIARRRLEEAGVATAELDARVTAEIHAVDDATVQALGDALADVTTAFADTFADGSSTWRT